MHLSSVHFASPHILFSIAMLKPSAMVYYLYKKRKIDNEPIEQRGDAAICKDTVTQQVCWYLSSYALVLNEV
jgi:hypothetical protein